MRAAKPGDSRCGYSRDVYPRRPARAPETPVPVPLEVPASPHVWATPIVHPHDPFRVVGRMDIPGEIDPDFPGCTA